MTNIKKIMDDYFAATSVAEKSEIEAGLLKDFEKLSPPEKETVRQMLLDDCDARMKAGMDNIGLSIKLAHVSQHVSLV